MNDIKELRIKAGLSQMKLASLLGVSLTSLIKWENGAGRPNAENLAKLKHIFTDSSQSPSGN